MTGPLAQQFAQVRERLSRGRDDDELLSGRDFRASPWDSALAALSSIERHLHDMEKALRNLIEWADNERGTDFGEREWDEARAALPAREKEEE